VSQDIFKRISNRFTIEFKKIVRPFLRSRANKTHISGQGIAFSCDLNISNIKNVDIKSIRNSYSIFVKSEYTEEFLVTFKDELAEKIVLAGNSDTNFLHCIPEMNIPKKLYLQNLGFAATSTIGLLPIGLENYEHVRSGFAFLHREPKRFTISNKILVPPMSATNPIREYVLSNVEKFPIFHKESRYLNVFKYFKLVRKYEYILVCEGNGLDTHRLWEVLYQGSKPVVFRSDFSRNLLRLGLPILEIVELSEVTEEALNQHRIQHKNYRKEDIEMLWLKYWKSEVALRP
jgi:hypothetical protein